jgi:hypothetical protein
MSPLRDRLDNSGPELSNGTIFAYTFERPRQVDTPHAYHHSELRFVEQRSLHPAAGLNCSAGWGTVMLTMDPVA